MFVTADQLVVHFVSDYLLQTDWIALNKKKPTWVGELACWIHALTYTLPFLFLTQSWKALFSIMFMHFVIDRTNLVPWLIWAKNQTFPGDFRATWDEAKANCGFHPSRPAFLSVWLCIICDNVLHIIWNALALRYL